MPSHSRGVIPLNWQELIAEAIRRRKAEKMTQREHAALAGVSIPTIGSFDRGERSLTLEKAFDILRVVGLVEEPNRGGAQENFVQDAFKRWRELTSKLPSDSPGRFPNGWYRIDYALEGDIKTVELHRLEDFLRRAVVPQISWPLFWLPKRNELAAYEKDGVLECWLKPADGGGDRILNSTPDNCDFWRATPTGRAFIIRGYREDSQETFSPRTIFDTTLPTWRIGEALLHADRLASALSQDKSKVKVKLRVLFTGLSGRVLRSWANPMSDLFMEGGAARSDEAVLEATVPVSDIDKNLAAHVHPLVASLFERFGVTGLTIDRVAAELLRMRGGHF